MYAVAVECLPRGATVPALTIRWQKQDGQWTSSHEDQTFVFKPATGEWQNAFGVVSVPAGVGQLVILLDVRGQIADGDVCWFDNLALYRLMAW
jgi:hypothetical protein